MLPAGAPTGGAGWRLHPRNKEWPDDLRSPTKKVWHDRARNARSPAVVKNGIPKKAAFIAGRRMARACCDFFNKSVENEWRRELR